MRQGRGFTYLGLLLAVALGSTALAAAGTLWSLQAKREKEAELLFAGDQIRAAIASYRDKSPIGQPQLFPRTLEELLEDRRWPTRRRHLRKVYVDPMSGKADWGLVQAPDGSVTGVFSRSEGSPLKRGLFAPEHEAFEDAVTYRDWRFVYGAPPPREQNASAP